VAKLEQMKAAKAVADAQLANVLVGTRVETISARKAEMERAQAALVLAQKTYERARILTEQGMHRRPASTRRPTRCTKASAQWIRRPRPISRR
jgi:multidrug resistance efflux pump